MAHYIGPKLRKSRGLSVPVVETAKYVNLHREKRPGPHGYRKVRLSQYGMQLAEKQKNTYYYNIRDAQLRRYVRQARLSKHNSAPELQHLLETRLDNVVRRLRWARTIWQAHQLITNGHFLINSRKVNMPSFNVKPGDAIAVKPNSISLIKSTVEKIEYVGFRVPDWLRLDEENCQAIVRHLPEPGEIRIPLEIDFAKVIEYYSS